MFLFLSDSHFGIGTPEDQVKRRDRLFACLDHHADRISKLFIMGDLFDFWFEWKHVILKRHFQVLCKLKNLTAKGIELHYLAGNHDFVLSQFLRDEIGAQTHLNHYQFEADGLNFYLSHGDGLAPADWGYRILKRIFRHSANQRLFSWLHPDLGVSLAHYSSFTSRNHTSRRWDVDGYAYREAAEKLINGGADVVVFAHTHEPLLEAIGPGVHLNTGDWMKNFSYALYGQGVMRLEYWGQPFLHRCVPITKRTR